MRKISFADVSIFVLKYIFNWRFWIAEITKKSNTYKKIVDKMLFEDDEILVISLNPPAAIVFNRSSLLLCFTRLTREAEITCGR